MAISIHLNGEPHMASEGQTILDLLHSLEIEPERVAIELDRRIVKQLNWASTELRDGAQIEIVQFVGGG